MWSDWFNMRNLNNKKVAAEVIPLSPRLLKIVNYDLSRLSPAVREFFEERAGIREFHGNMSRQDAEAGAWEDIQPYLEQQRWSFDEWLCARC